MNQQFFAPGNGAAAGSNLPPRGPQPSQFPIIPTAKIQNIDFSRLAAYLKSPLLALISKSYREIHVSPSTLFEQVLKVMFGSSAAAISSADTTAWILRFPGLFWIPRFDIKPASCKDPFKVDLKLILSSPGLSDVEFATFKDVLRASLPGVCCGYDGTNIAFVSVPKCNQFSVQNFEIQYRNTRAAYCLNVGLHLSRSVSENAPVYASGVTALGSAEFAISQAVMYKHTLSDVERDQIWNAHRTKPHFSAAQHFVNWVATVHQCKKFVSKDFQDSCSYASQILSIEALDPSPIPLAAQNTDLSWLCVWITAHPKWENGKLLRMWPGTSARTGYAGICHAMDASTLQFKRYTGYSTLTMQQHQDIAFLPAVIGSQAQAPVLNVDQKYSTVFVEGEFSHGASFIPMTLDPLCINEQVLGDLVKKISANLNNSTSSHTDYVKAKSISNIVTVLSDTKTSAYVKQFLNDHMTPPPNGSTNGVRDSVFCLLSLSKNDACREVAVEYETQHMHGGAAIPQELASLAKLAGKFFNALKANGEMEVDTNQAVSTQSATSPNADDMDVDS